MTNPFVTLADIEEAHARIYKRIRRTFTNTSQSLSKKIGHPVYLKLEHQQITGSFKLRGATNAVLSLSEEERARGIIAVSTGNHGRGLAYAAKSAGSRATICMSELVPQAKLDGIAALGADIRIIGRSQDEAQNEVDRLVAEKGMTMIPPFDHPAVIAGQGTLGLEILDDAPDVECVLVQLSGGGLISGVAAAIKAKRPRTRIIGISMERGAAMHASLKAGHPVEVEELPTLADSLGGGIGLNNRLTFAMTRALVDDVITLSEAEIADGIRHCYSQEAQIVEGSGAVGVAAILAGKINAAGPVVTILSGGNIDLAHHQRIVCGGDNE
ncbi:hydroxyectoine utilization dehydratase EutB [Ahrensia marina]|uniref:Threonine dehydratase n=1 Tax=Ahrensia marina TaxID=1514904 RepID=A0A0M9GMC1_9HYPH|nr:hydroxyectoine utilization dehydratase EutB [Ahrensia marina]KPB00816.1 threonine dehydratase [Ahrensia marina]